ncbi:VanW family protein [Labrys portucalensis]|uniref:VanW family protein n=1 Tax=Labrys neptuniae TaxID=376174 RepID=A0ABV6ZPQ3_9HYPH
MVALPQRNVPTYADSLAFEAKAMALRGLRFLREKFTAEPVARHGRSARLAAAPVLGRAGSPLWTNVAGARDRELTAGKVQNLRMALKGLDGVEVPAGAVLSFWKQVGRASRARGYVPGRELREGCLIASVGGGLCQLSNALYEAALAAGLEIVERHAHSRVVPGSRAQLGRDATVFWNYVDFRIRSPHPFRIEASMSRDRLEIVLRGHGRAKAAELSVETPAAGPAVHDCTQCGQQDCHRNDPERALRAGVPTAWLVDACWPEFATLLEQRAGSEDALFLPSRRLGAPRYGWPSGMAGSETTATIATLRRSLALRGATGGSLQAKALQGDARLAAAYATRLSHRHTHLVVSQNLLPHLWLSGALQGRSFEVLMERLPLAVLQARLDAAAMRHPESATLADFRAPAAIVAAESDALAAADRLLTPHREIATLDPARTQLLDWSPARPLSAARGGRTLLFPASALGRKGAYALREALYGLPVELAVKGHARESLGFWGNMPVRLLAPGEMPATLAGVVLPAVVEHQPRLLLAALAAGLPVIATPACGLAARPGLTLVPEEDPAALRRAIETLFG